ncbi:MAG: hypothetical protein HY554_10780 [Elusimicrobia bacterium]|nr:hypothetical protein [Elusimicrobiota bacterium]
MSFHGTTVMVTGEQSPLLATLASHLGSLGARLVESAEQPKDEVRYLFHVWSPREPAVLARPAFGWYEGAVAEPIRRAARLAGGLAHLCLIRSEASSVPVRVLEEALRFLARRSRVPFAVLDTPEDGRPGRVPAVAAFVASAGLAGRIAVGPRS